MWLAKDASGEWYTYPLRPRTGEAHWVSGGRCVQYNGPRIVQNIHWKDSLIDLEELTQLDRIEARLIAIEEMLKGGQL